MSSDNTILPERNSLILTSPVSDFRIIYADPEPIYRFVFRVDIFNSSKLTVRLLARKWTMVSPDDNIFIIEAENVFNTSPILSPRGVFSFGGMHDFPAPPKRLELRLAGIDQLLTPFISAPCVFSKKQLTPVPAF